MHPRIEELFFPSKQKIREKIRDMGWYGWFGLLSDDGEIEHLCKNGSPVHIYRVHNKDFDILIYTDNFIVIQYVGERLEVVYWNLEAFL